MRIHRSIFTAVVLACIVALPATTLSQEKTTTEDTQQKPGIVLNKQLTVEFWKDLLGLQGHQVKLLTVFQTEAKERLETEAQEFADDPEFIKQLTNDVTMEFKERLREVLNEEQLVKYEKFMAKEKQKAADLEHPRDAANPDNHPDDPDNRQ